jgi:hypothetical protein
LPPVVTVNFLALLLGRNVPTSVYCFDLLRLNGRDMREQPFVQRCARLQALLARAKCNVIRFSEAFSDPNAILRSAHVSAWREWSQSGVMRPIGLAPAVAG